MISKAVLCHTLVIWGLVQVTTQVALSRAGIPAGVRSSMIANGWRPLTGYEGKTSVHHPGSSSSNNGGSSIVERHSSPHPVHGKLHEHMASSEKLAAKHNKQSHEYNPPSILGSFAVFGQSMAKLRNGGESGKSHQKGMMASETREFSFLVPPPRDPVRYDIDPYRKVILRDNDAYLRQPGQYIISHSLPQQDTRNVQYYPKGGVSVAASTHVLTASKNRPLEYNGGVLQSQQPQHQALRQQHIPFESLKLSNTKHYLQPPSGNGPINFANEQQASDTLYNRYPTPSAQHNSQLGHEGNFYSQINHPAPNYKGLERDPGFLVHESHEVSYPTQASPAVNAYSNFRPSTPYENSYPTERYSTARPQSIVQTDKFVPSKPEILQQNSGYGQYSQNGNANLENTIISSEPTYSNGIANTYYISEQQNLSPPAPNWSAPANKVTPDINEVLPKTSRPPKFNSDSGNIEGVRQDNRQQIADYLFPRPEVQQKQLQPQQHYANNPLALINQQAPENAYETPESISLKHFNEQQFKLQQQLLQRDRDRLREQELQRQQQEIEFSRIAAIRNKEKTASTRPTQETPKPTPQYIDTTVSYGIGNIQDHNQEYHLVTPQQALQQEYHQEFQPIRTNVDVVYQTGSPVPDVTDQPELPSTYESIESTTGNRNRPRKPSTSNEQHRRRKPTTPLYEENNQYHHLSTLAPNPIVSSPGSSFSHGSSTEEPTTVIRVTTSTPETTQASTTTTTTSKPRTRRPTASNGPGGRRRRPNTTTTQEPDTIPPVTYEQAELVKHKKLETDAARRRRVKPSTTLQPQPEEVTTSTEKKRYEIKNYGNKLGQNEQFGDFVTEIVTLPEDTGVSQSYSYTNEQEVPLYTPSYDSPVTTGQEATEYETSGYPTSTTFLSTQNSPTEQQYVDHSGTLKNVHTSIPLEELFVNTERITTTTSAPPTTTTEITTTTAAAPPPTRASLTKSTRIVTTSSESGSTRAPNHRMRPMRFGNSTRPRFSIKDYKSRLDYRSRMSSTSEAPVASSSASRHKASALKNQQDGENPDVESTTATTGRYRHMSRVSYRVSSTTPTYQSRRTESSGNSTTERSHKYAPKRRLHPNHLYRSKTTTSTTEPTNNDGESTTSRHNSVRHENVYSSAIRRRPQMKHSVFTQSSDIRSTKKDATEMVPEETSFYPSAISQLLTEIVTSPSGKDVDNGELVTQSVKEVQENDFGKIVTTTSGAETESPKDALTVAISDDFQSSKVESLNTFEYTVVTTPSPVEDAGKTEALVKSESPVTIDSQLDDDLFAKASQSVADLTSSASALYDKPGMFKAVSIAPSGSDSTIISSRYKIGQEKPTLPIEAFFHELSNKN